LIKKLKDPRRGHWKYGRAIILRKLLTPVRHSRKTRRSRIKRERRRDLLERRIRNPKNRQYLPQVGRLYKIFHRAKLISIRRTRPTVGDAGIRGIRYMNAMQRKQLEEQSSLVERQPR
jgi:hypothetical protein